jgi:hypothetical protein
MRSGSGAGTTRIVVVDLATGPSSDLFTGFEVVQSTPTEPSISPAGDTVYTSGPFESAQSPFFASVTATSLAPFPAGPYTHSSLRPQYGVALIPSREHLQLRRDAHRPARHRQLADGRVPAGADGRRALPGLRAPQL